MRKSLVTLLFGSGLLITTLSYAQCPKSAQQLKSYEAYLQRQEVANDPDHAGQIDKVLIEMSRGDAAAVRQGIKAGLGPNATVKSSNIGPHLAKVIAPISLLTVAVDMCQEQIAEDLVKSGASANGDENDVTPFSDRGSPLNDAAAFGEATLVDFLIKHGAVVDQPDVMGDTPLLNAVIQSRAAAVSVLLKDGANPNQRSGRGDTVLDLADQVIAKELIRYGAKNGAVGGNDPHKETKTTACFKPPNSLQSYEADLQQLEDRNDPVHAWQIDKVLIEIGQGEQRLVREDIKAGLSPNATVDTSITFPHYGRRALSISLVSVAVAMCQERIAEELVNLGASANGDGGADKGRPLRTAAAFGEATLVDFLIKHGAVVDQPDPIMGDTPLVNAVVNGRVAVVAVLLKDGADPNQFAGRGCSRGRATQCLTPAPASRPLACYTPLELARRRSCDTPGSTPSGCRGFYIPNTIAQQRVMIAEARTIAQELIHYDAENYCK